MASVRTTQGMRIAIALPLLLIGLAAPATSPAYAADTCFGLAPTIVGTNSQTQLTGTAGPDVVITNGARAVDVLAGDDTVCVTGDTYDVDAGDGEDRVDGTAATDYHRVNLGHGADTYTGGGPRGVSVKTGDQKRGQIGDPVEVDEVRTGVGPDEVTTGTDGIANPDTVSTGGGGDTVTVRGDLPTTLDGSAGRDELRLSSQAGGDWRIDNRTGVVTHDGVVAGTAISFTLFDLESIRYDALSFRGGPDDEVVDVVNLSGTTRNGPFSARMGPGQDTIVAHSTDVGPFAGGPGGDLIEVAAYRTVRKPDSFTADLRSDTFRLRGFDPVRIASLEDFSVTDAPGAAVVGDDRPNTLTASGCNVVVDGRGGDDRIAGGTAKSCYTDDAALGLTAYGGPGDDRLRGSITRDRLIGGTGNDRADGSSGRDQCVAEHRVDCER